MSVLASMIICILLLICTAQFSHGQTVAGAPALVQVVPYNHSCLQVDITPPESDGGQAVTAYEIQWDTEPGIREIQTISTVVNIQPNEIQVVETYATHEDEVQTVKTTATDVDEIQTIVVSSTLSSDIGGSFTIVFDDSSTGGSAEESAPVAANLVANPAESNYVSGNHQSLEEVLENMQNVGNVTVSQTVVASDNGSPPTRHSVTYSITFHGNARDLPQLKLGTSQLTGAGVDVSFATHTDGNKLAGDFLLTYEGQTTQPIPFDATPAQLKQRLEALSSVDTVNVLRSVADAELGYTWTVTFTSDAQKGALGMLQSDKTGLQGVGAAIAHARVDLGNQLGGYISMSFNSNGPANISFDASAADFENVLENSLSTGSVDVIRTGPGVNGEYAWTVSFVGMAGDVPALTGAKTFLTGTGADVTTTEAHKGTAKEKKTITMTTNETVTFTFDSVTTMPLDGSLGCAAPMKARLEALPTIGTLTVLCTDNGGAAPYVWTVIFDTNAGNLGALSHNGSNTNVVDTIDGTSTTLGGKFTVAYAGQRTQYLPVNIQPAALKSALESLSSIGTVDVERSDVTENDGYVWSITFQTEMGNIPLMTTDSVAMTGTMAEAKVAEFRTGVNPPFNSTLGGTHPLNYDRVTDLQSLRYFIVYHQKDDYVEQVRQGVPYYVRVSAINSVGEGPYAVSTPRSVMPISLPPSSPTDVQLHVIDGYSLNVTFNPPLHSHGKAVDKYKVEWDSTEVLEEVQSITITSPVTKEVQIIRTVASDVNETQIVRTVTTSDGVNIQTEKQGIECNSNGGNLRLTFKGETTAPISWDATASQIQTALNSLSTITTVTVTIANTQTTLCASSSPELVTVEFVSVPGMAGDMPLMTTDVNGLQGNKAVTIVESRVGKANLGGTFTLTFRGQTTAPLAHSVSHADLATALTPLLGSSPTVSRGSVGTGGIYAWTIVFTDPTLGGNIENLVVDAGGLTGNGASAAVCGDASTAGPCTGQSIPGNELGGTFALTLLGHKSPPIPYNAEQTTMKSSLELMDNIGTVDVLRSGPTPEGGYDWTITFTSMPGSFPIGSENVDILGVDDTLLTGSGKSLTSHDVVHGSNALTGTFKVSFDNTGGNNQQTVDIKKDASAEEMKSFLEAMPNVGSVAVTKTINADGYTWKVTFSSCRTRSNDLVSICNVGDLRLLTADDTNVGSGSVSVSQVIQGTGQAGNVTLHPSMDYNVAEITDLSGGGAVQLSIDKFRGW